MQKADFRIRKKYPPSNVEYILEIRREFMFFYKRKCRSPASKRNSKTKNGQAPQTVNTFAQINSNQTKKT